MTRSTYSTAKTASKSPSKLTITKAFIDGLEPTGKRQVYRDDKARGLLLRVNADGSKVWYFDYRDPDGNRQSFKLGDADRLDPGDARKRLKTLGEDPAGERRLQRAEQAAAEVEVERSASRTLRAFLEGTYWDTHLKHARSGLATQKRILAAWAPLLDTDMTEITAKAAKEHQQKRRDAGVRPQTLNRDRTALLALLNHAAAGEEKDRIIPKNRLAGRGVFDALETDDDKRVRYLGMRDDHESIADDTGRKLGERERFMTALADEVTPVYLRRIVLLALNTGLRRGEIFKLEWARVSLQNASLTVSAVTAKNKEPRHIVLNAVALGVLKELAAERDEAQKKDPGKPTPLARYVFVNADTGLPFTTLKKSMAALLQRARIEDFHLHDCRHEFASRLVQAGVNLYEVKDLLGHSTIQLTERYSHLAPHAQRAAVALLESA